jgi:hypothetical protein
MVRLNALGDVMMKQRTAFGRSRLAPWRAHRPFAAAHTPSARLAAALRVARAFVQDRWPELGCVEPRMMSPLRRSPSPALLERLGVQDQEIVLHRPGGAEYTFTFAGETAPGDAPPSPLVATVTVDDQQRIVKALISK